MMKLPEKQAKRIYARYYLCMTVNEIAAVEGVDPSRVRDSIRRGLKKLEKNSNKSSVKSACFYRFLSLLIEEINGILLPAP